MSLVLLWVLLVAVFGDCVLIVLFILILYLN